MIAAASSVHREGILTEGIVVQVRGTFGGDYGPETYNVGDIWGGRQI